MIYKNFHLKPLTINQAWAGRRFKTKIYKEFRDDFTKLCRAEDPMMGWVKISLIFTLRKETFGITDVDNLIKPTLDAIVENGYIEDDRKVIELRATKRMGDDYSIQFLINEADTNKNEAGDGERSVL